MFHFFVEEEQINGSGILVTGPDVNHIRNVLRMKPGERALISSRGGGDYLCEVRELLPDYIRMEAVEKKADSMELPARIHLFQGLPKSDKMELIIQKAVEYGGVFCHSRGGEALHCEAGSEAGAGPRKAVAGHCRERGEAVKAQHCS